MSDEWGKQDGYDPWAVPEQPPESEALVVKPPKEKRPPRDKKHQGERKPPREKKPTVTDPSPTAESTEADAVAEGDAWGVSNTEDSYDPWADPVEKPEQEVPVAKPPREKRKPPRDRKPPADSKSTGETSSPADALTSPEVETPISPIQGDSNNERKKSQAYHNPERVLTGGAQRDKLSEEQLTERMTRMREQNEKIKQRRMDIIADEDAFKKTQDSERIKLEKIRKEQEQVNRTREQNARRKMDKISSREWDEGKASANWKQAKKDGPDSSAPSESARDRKSVV